MKLKETQMQFILKELRKNGRISRNYCLKNFITRLSAFIYDLKEEGWDFKAGFNEFRDYIYIVVKKPKQV